MTSGVARARDEDPVAAGVAIPAGAGDRLPYPALGGTRPLQEHVRPRVDEEIDAGLRGGLARRRDLGAQEIG